MIEKSANNLIVRCGQTNIKMIIREEPSSERLDYILFTHQVHGVQIMSHDELFYMKLLCMQFSLQTNALKTNVIPTIVFHYRNLGEHL